MPNKVQIIEKNYNFMMQEKNTWQVLVKTDFTVDAKHCPNGNLKTCDKETVKGRWQTIYDQTLIVELENDLRFIGTFRYQIKKNVTNNATKLAAAFTDVDDFMKAQFNSVCNQTMVGFVQNTTHQSTYKKHRIQCLYAHKDWDNIYEQEHSVVQVGAGKMEKSQVKSNQSVDIGQMKQSAQLS